MGNDLITTELLAAAAAFSAQSLTPSTKTVLERAFQPGAVFTAAEIALVEPIASAVAPVQPADERTIRQSVGALASALPSQDRGELGGKLQLRTYTVALAGCDQRALAYACRRCLDELDWLPTIRQLKERIDHWVSPEAAAISRARMIMRAGRRAPEGADGVQVEASEVAALRARLSAVAADVRQRPHAVAYSDPAPLRPDQIRIPNKGDYERLFGIDPEAERAKAEAAQAAEELYDRDLLAVACQRHVDLYGHG